MRGIILVRSVGIGERSPGRATSQDILHLKCWGKGRIVFLV